MQATRHLLDSDNKGIKQRLKKWILGEVELAFKKVHVYTNMDTLHNQFTNANWSCLQGEAQQVLTDL